VISYLRQNGAYVFKTVTTGKAGVPDVIGCFKGVFLAFEIKAGSRLTELQKYNIKQISLAGGIATVITELNQVALIIDTIAKNNQLGE